MGQKFVVVINQLRGECCYNFISKDFVSAKIYDSFEDAKNAANNDIREAWKNLVLNVWHHSQEDYEQFPPLIFELENQVILNDNSEEDDKFIFTAEIFPISK